MKPVMAYLGCECTFLISLFVYITTATTETKNQRNKAKLASLAVSLLYFVASNTINNWYSEEL